MDSEIANTEVVQLQMLADSFMTDRLIPFVNARAGRILFPSGTDGTHYFIAITPEDTWESDMLDYEHDPTGAALKAIHPIVGGEWTPLPEVCAGSAFVGVITCDSNGDEVLQTADREILVTLKS